MTGIILASHGGLAEGVLQSLGMILGEQEDVYAVTLLPSDSPDILHAKLLETIQKLSDPSQVLFLVDLQGGTPYNQSNAILGEHPDYAILAGLSLPMLIVAVSERMMAPDATAHQLATAIIPQAHDGITVTPEELAPAEPEAEAAPAAAAPQTPGSIPEGTVLGTGHIDYGLVRVDSRLLHGQVATGWSKAVKPDRIIVVSDAVSKDELRKGLIMKAAPPGIKAHVIPLWKFVEIDKDPRFGATRALILFETPQDVLKVMQDGVKFTTINLGSMAHSVGKVLANKVLSFDQNDIDTVEAIKAMGVEFDIRKVPGNTPEKIEDILSTAKRELAKQHA